jgi:chromosome segregation ATPase
MPHHSTATATGEQHPQYAYPPPYPYPPGPYPYPTNPGPSNAAQKLLEDFDKEAPPVVDMDLVMDRVDTSIENLRKDVFSRFATTKQFESLDSRVLSKLEDLERQLEQTKEDVTNSKNMQASHSYDINDLKVQVHDLKNQVTDHVAKLNRLHDDYHSHAFDLDIDALYKKLQTFERQLNEKVDSDVFDKEINAAKFMNSSHHKAPGT